MAAVDYWGIEQAICAQLEGDTSLAGVPVQPEAEAGWPEDRAIYVYLTNRTTPEGQPIAAGRRMLLTIEYSVWCYAENLELATAAQNRDDLLGAVELALMQNPTLDGKVDALWLEGGQFHNAQNESNSFNLGGEIKVMVQKRAIIGS